MALNANAKSSNSQHRIAITSSEIQQLMADPELLSQPQMVPKIMVALHHLSTVSVVTIVLSEKEQAVIDGIKSKLKTLDEVQEEVNRLKSEYPQSQQRVENLKTTQFEAVTVQIKETFDPLISALTLRKQSLLNQLNDIKLAMESEHDELKEDELTECTQNINDLRHFLKEQQEKYHGLISVEKDHAERQSEILEIGNEVNSQFAVQHNAIGDVTQSVRDRMTKNNATEIVVHFVANKVSQQRMTRDIGSLGRIRHLKQQLQFEWVAEAPPAYSTKYLYSIGNQRRTITKTRNGDYAVMARSNPWLKKGDDCGQRIRAFIKVDAVRDGAEDCYAVGVITRWYWERRCYLGASTGKGVHNWRFTGDVYLGADRKQSKMPKIDAANQVIGIEIDFEENVVKYELYENGKMNEVVASSSGTFPELETQEVCVALSVRSTGWQFSFK